MKHIKQTALQWFKDVTYPYLDKESKEYVDILFNNALQMEREKIVESCNSQKNDYRGMPTYNKSGEQYYNETYGGKNE
jgi:hypothetical protein